MYYKTKSRKKWLAFSLVLALILSLILPATGMGAEEKSLVSALNAEQLTLPSVQAPSAFNHSGKLELYQSSDQRSATAFQAEKVGAEETVATQSIQPQNHVPASDSSARISVIVELKSDPMAAYRAKVKQGLMRSDTAYQSKLAAEQDSFATAAKKLDVQLDRQYKHVFNGYSLTIPANQVDSLLQLPGVKAVYQNLEVKVDPIESITPNMDESAPYIGSNVYWDLGYDGTGIKVGVLDTGIDYNHPSLRDAYKGGYDFVDNDDDPMETPPDPTNPDAATDHGTHVAGTVGGRGNPTDPNSETGWVRGVAHGSDIYAYRVLGPGGRGSTANILAAVERATLDEMDIINLSLGADVNDKYDPLSIALNNSMLDGVVAVTSNGNSGPDPYTVGIPATSELAISVGSSLPPLNIPTINGDGVEKVYASIMSFSPDVGDLVGQPLEIVGAGLGTPADFTGIDVAGKVALISRGSISFGEKSVNAQNAGAIAAIIYNNAPGNFGGTLGEKGNYIPTMSISQEDGLALLAQANANEDYSITFGTELEQDFIADSSSRGPSLPHYGIKPDIAAPGVGIRSSVPAFDGNYEDAYADLAGTSMASPHIAGAAALLLQKDPSLSTFEVKSLLMNNALKISDRDGQRYSHMDQGAGRVDLENTIGAKAIALVGDTTDASATGQDIPYLTGSISFGQQLAGSTVSRTVTLKDIVGQASVYTLATTWYGPSAGDIVTNSPRINVRANGQQQFDITLNIGQNTPDGRYEGEVILEERSGHRIQVPISVYVGEPETPDVVSNIELDPVFFSPNGDGVTDTTDITFKINSATQYFSLDVYDAETLDWLGTIVETFSGITPGNYIVRDWDGTVVNLSGRSLLDEGFYVVIPWHGTLIDINPIIDQASPFVVDVTAPVSTLDDPAITEQNGVGTITGQVVSDFMIDLFGDYSAIGVAALYEDNGWKQANGVIADDGSFSIQVPLKSGLNTFEIYVYDIADNGVLEPAHIVEYEYDGGENPPEPQPGISAVASSSEVKTGDPFSISVNFSDLDDVYAAQFSLTYDSDLLKGSVEPSVTLATYQEEQNPGTSLILDEQTVDLGNGQARSDYIVSLVGDISGYTGAGTLATFNFTSEEEGTFAFDLSNVRILNSHAEDINYGPVTGTTVTVTETSGPGPDPDYSISGKITAEALGEVNYGETWYEGADGVHKVIVEAVSSDGSISKMGTVQADGTYHITVPAGTYTVRVVVPSHIGVTESVTVDQDVSRNFGPLTAGDVNQDGKVDLVDLQLVAKEFGKVRGSGWSNAKASAADINRDNAVDLRDISFILHNFER